MGTKNDSGLTPVIAALFCILASIGAGLSLSKMAPKFGGWMAVGYVLVAAVFISIAAVIFTQVLSALRDPS